MSEAATLNAILLDDNEDDRETFRRLERYGLPVKATAPPSLSGLEDIVSAVHEGDYDLVLVDFLLDQEAPEPEEVATYRGSAPAALLKDRCPQVPVVLVTTENRYHQYLEHRSQLGSLFDLYLPKSRVRTQEDRQIVADELRDLALGFRRLTSIATCEDSNERWGKLQDALAATDEELRCVREVWPNELPDSVSELAQWLLKGLLKCSGPLRDETETAVMIGVTGATMKDEAMRAWAETAEYTGVFSKICQRWWSGRLLDALEDSLGELAFGPSGERASALAENVVLQEPFVARCSWCEEPSVHRVCWICGDPVDATHHLRIGRSQQPSWALPEVVCFRCIETGEDEAAGIRYGPGTADLIEDLRAGRLRRR